MVVSVTPTCEGLIVPVDEPWKDNRAPFALYSSESNYCTSTSMTEVFGQRALLSSMSYRNDRSVWSEGTSKFYDQTGMAEVFGQRALLSSMSYRNDRSVWSEGTSKFYVIQE